MEMTSEDKQGDGDPGDNGGDYGYGLTDAETLQILNHLPVTEPVEIHLMIEDLPSRLDKDRQTELLDCLKEFVEEKAEDGDVADPEEEEIVEEEEVWEEEIVEEDEHYDNKQDI